MNQARSKAFVGGLLLVAMLAGLTVIGWRSWPTSDHAIQASFRQALSSIQTGSTVGVEHALTLLDSDPRRDAHADLLRGVLLLRADRSAEAIEFLSRVPLNGPLRREALLFQGEALCRLGQPVEAQRLLGAVVREDPNNAEVHRWLAISYYDLGAYEPARHHLTSVLARLPDDLSALHMMGLMFRDFNEHGEAITYYRRALNQNPSGTLKQELVADLADSLLEMRRFDEAESLLASFQQSGPAVLVLKARCEFGFGRNESALNLLDEVPSEAAVNADFALLKAEILTTLGRSDDALQVLRTAAQQLSFETELAYRLALQLQKLGQTEEAALQMARWKELDELTRRLTELNLTAVEQPDNADVRHQLADVCRKLGKTDLAEMWTRAAEESRKLQGPASETSPPNGDSPDQVTD